MKLPTRTILHIDFNSYFATIEQQANPRLRGKPIGVTGGDRTERTVLGAASVEAKKLGVKTGMALWEAKAVCPQIILVKGDSDKYLECTKRFLNILKDYSPALEVFSIDESFLELFPIKGERNQLQIPSEATGRPSGFLCTDERPLKIAEEIKRRIRKEVGEWVTCSIGISYCKLMAKLASSLYKPDGLVAIADTQAAEYILDRVELDDICGIGSRIKKRLYNLGVVDFPTLRQVPRESLLAAFKSYGGVLYNMARGEDFSPVAPFYQKEEVKSVGHRHTLNKNTIDKEEIRQLLLKLTELIARRLRSKKLIGKTVDIWLRYSDFSGEGMQLTISFTDDGLEIFKGAFKGFNKIWDGREIRMIGTSLSNLKPKNPQNLTFLEDRLRQDKIIGVLDKINDRFGEFTLKRGVLLGSQNIYRKPNSFLSDRRFKI